MKFRLPLNRYFTFQPGLIALATGFFALIGSTPARACDDVAFAVTEQLPVLGPSLNVVVADFNGDGNDDFAATNDAAVVVFLGDGAGGFGDSHSYPAGLLPRGMAVGNFNGDNQPDLAVSNYNDISVLLNDGQGGFEPPVNFPAHDSPIAVATGDFNGDGKTDLVAVNSQSNDVSIILGNGAGGFGPPQNFPAGDLPYAVAVGDFDGDGRVDLAVSTYTSEEVRIMRGDGQGGFTTFISYPLHGNGSRIVAGDFNHDDHLDLAVGVYNASPDNRLAVLLGNGNGTFTRASGIPVADPQGVVTADFDGDGNLDLASTTYFFPDLVVALGDGAGGFGPARSTRLPGHPYPFGVAPADFNRDGKADLAISNYGNGHVIILLNLPTAEIEAVVPKASEGDRIRGRFQVARNGCTDNPLSLQYTVSGTARPGVDYRELRGWLLIPAGRRFAPIQVIPLGDMLEEDGATVIVTLLPDVDHVIGKESTATVTIYNQAK